MNYKVLVYHNTNLGDIIQTIALTRFLEPTIGVIRDRETTIPGPSIINGFISRNTKCGECLFAGVHVGTSYRRLIRWLRESKYIIGARDPASHQIITGWGLKSEMIGCASLTFDTYTGSRSNIYSVDYNGPGIKLTHNISKSMPIVEQWNEAMRLLDLYRTAEAVYTTRLHVALPCLAFGTPVYLDDSKAFRPERLSLLKYMGIPTNQLVIADISKYKDNYLRFLYNNAKCIEKHDPIMPS